MGGQVASLGGREVKKTKTGEDIKPVVGCVAPPGLPSLPSACAQDGGRYRAESERGHQLRRMEKREGNGWALLAGPGLQRKAEETEGQRALRSPGHGRS